jgi:flagellar motor switch protein FliM
MVDGVPIMESRYGIQNGQYALKVEALPRRRGILIP